MAHFDRTSFPNTNPILNFLKNRTVLFTLVTIQLMVLVIMLVNYQTPHTTVAPTSGSTCDLYWRQEQRETLLLGRPFPSYLEKHEFLFIGGLHHSGTGLMYSLLGMHDEFSTLKVNTKGNPESEGHFVQRVFKAASKLPGMRPDYRVFVGLLGAHMTENDWLVKPGSSESIWGSWSKYWDTSKTFLVEKSPPTIVRSRFLQKLFPKSSFVFIVKHPLTTLLGHGPASSQVPDYLKYEIIGHWVQAHTTLLMDLKYIHNFYLVRYEDLIKEESLEGIMNTIYEGVGAKRDDDMHVAWSHDESEDINDEDHPKKQIEITIKKLPPNEVQPLDHAAGPTQGVDEAEAETIETRKLLHFHGDRKNITISDGAYKNFLTAYEKSRSLSPTLYQQLRDNYAPALKKFGYLIDAPFIEPTPPTLLEYFPEGTECYRAKKS